MLGENSPRISQVSTHPGINNQTVLYYLCKNVYRSKWIWKDMVTPSRTNLITLGMIKIEMSPFPPQSRFAHISE